MTVGNVTEMFRPSPNLLSIPPLYGSVNGLGTAGKYHTWYIIGLAPVEPSDFAYPH